MKKKLNFIVVSLFMILGLGILLFPFQLPSVLKESSIKDDYTLQFVGMNDALKNGDKYTVVGDDAYLIFDLGEEQSLFSVKIYLSDPINQDMDIRLYYADATKEFSESKSCYEKIKKGENDLVFGLSGNKNRYIRVDIEEYPGFCLRINKVAASVEKWTYYVRLCFSFHNLKSAFILYFGIVFVWFIKKRNTRVSVFIYKHENFAAVSLIIICVTVLYFQYLSGEIYYIFKDIGGDSYLQSYPYLINTARRISHGLWKGIFNFAEGLGNPNSYIVLGLNNWMTLFGEKNVAYLMGVSQWIKVILTGILAYQFSRVYGNGYKLSIAAAFGYAFNAFVMIRGAWNGYPDLALLLIMWLTVYEYYHKGKKVYLLPITTVCFFYSLDIYDCVLWGVALAAYIVFREFSEQRCSKVFFYKLCKTQIQYWCFALLGMADGLVNYLAGALQSRRFSSNASVLMLFIKNDPLTEIKELIVLFLRTIGMTINGVADYRGSMNFLEDPAFYCGILFLLLIPLALFHMEGRKRGFYIFAYIMAGIYVVLRPVRYIINGFASMTYKLSSLWIIAVMIITVLSFFRYCFSDGREFRKKSALVFNFTIVLVMLCMFMSLKSGYVVRFKNWLFTFGCVAVYGIIINFMLFNKISRKLAADILCICVVVEVLFTSWDCVNGRGVISKVDAEEGMLYNNTAKNAVDNLKNEDLGWYRIEKKYGEAFLCDSLAQDYNGTKSYVGGTGIGSSVLDYYFDLELPHNGDHYLYGIGGDVYVGALLGVKYYITKSGQEIYSYGLKYLKTVNDVDIYENTLALPLAYAYNKTVSNDVVQQFSGTDKRKIMLDECIADGVDSSFYQNNYIAKDACGMCKYEPIQKDGKYYLDIPENHVLVIKLITNSNELWNMYGERKGETVYNEHYSFEAGVANSIEIYVKDLDAISFSNNALISETEFYLQDADVYYSNTKSAVEKLSENALQMESFNESHIEGEIVCDQEMILATSIPYDDKWQIYVDGEKVDVIKVNIGFVGAELSSGRHKVDIRYESNSWIYDNKFKCAGVIFAILIILKRFLNQKSKLCKIQEDM